MPVVSLHWFRRKQRAIARFALAAFCLTWLQVAALPCVMALDQAGGGQMPADMQMPAEMVMAPGEHCIYCPPEAAGADAPGTPPDFCAFPHDPQVDLRMAFAAAVLAPPPVVVLLLAEDRTFATTELERGDAAPPLPHIPVAVSFCRFLK
jgi:hypothetical protein